MDILYIYEFWSIVYTADGKIFKMSLCTNNRSILWKYIVHGVRHVLMIYH